MLHLPPADVSELKTFTVCLEKFDERWKIKAKYLQKFFTCSRCCLIVKYQNHLDTHLLVCNNVPGQYECDFCGRIFVQKVGVKSHVNSHFKPKIFYCDLQCGKSFKNQNKLDRHALTNHSYKCHVCDLVLKSSELRTDHIANDHGGKYPCRICPYVASSKGLQNAHERIHSKCFQCETCDQKFSANQGLKRHQKVLKHGMHITDPDENFDCEICNTSYGLLQNLKHHIKLVHTAKSIRCHICSKNFKNKMNLQHHLTIHDKVPCPYCQKVFAKVKLNRHLRRHTTMFECDLCSRKCVEKNGLRNHIETFHPKGKIFGCEYRCSEKFSTIHDLFDHNRVHVGLKQWRCFKCNYSATRKQSFFMHIKTKAHENFT